MTDDLVKLLREKTARGELPTRIEMKAVDRIDALEAEVARLRGVKNMYRDGVARVVGERDALQVRLTAMTANADALAAVIQHEIDRSRRHLAASTLKSLAHHNQLRKDT